MPTHELACEARLRWKHAKRMTGLEAVYKFRLLDTRHLAPFCRSRSRVICLDATTCGRNYSVQRYNEYDHLAGFERYGAL